MSVQNVHIDGHAVKAHIEEEAQAMQIADMAGSRTERLHVLLTKEEMEQLDDWMFSQRVRTRGEAVRQMLKIAREATRPAEKPAAEKRRKPS
jgi:hypothetical protein